MMDARSISQHAPLQGYFQPSSTFSMQPLFGHDDSVAAVAAQGPPAVPNNIVVPSSRPCVADIVASTLAANRQQQQQQQQRQQQQQQQLQQQQQQQHSLRPLAVQRSLFPTHDATPTKLPPPPSSSSSTSSALSAKGRPLFSYALTPESKGGQTQWEQQLLLLYMLFYSIYSNLLIY